jgi:hypothetical protein
VRGRVPRVELDGVLGAAKPAREHVHALGDGDVVGRFTRRERIAHGRRRRRDIVGAHGRSAQDDGRGEPPAFRPRAHARRDCIIRASKARPRRPACMPDGATRRRLVRCAECSASVPAARHT